LMVAAARSRARPDLIRAAPYPRSPTAVTTVAIEIVHPK